jgi:hypothetical protein
MQENGSKETNEKNDDGDDQKDVYKSAERDACQNSEKPKYQKYYAYGD